MSKNEVTASSLADKIIDRLDEHKINPYDQAAALSIAFFKACDRVQISKAGAIEIVISTYQAYDNSNT